MLYRGCFDVLITYYQRTINVLIPYQALFYLLPYTPFATYHLYLPPPYF